MDYRDSAHLVQDAVAQAYRYFQRRDTAATRWLFVSSNEILIGAIDQRVAGRQLRIDLETAE